MLFNVFIINYYNLLGRPAILSFPGIKCLANPPLNFCVLVISLTVIVCEYIVQLAL